MEACKHGLLFWELFLVCLSALDGRTVSLMPSLLLIVRLIVLKGVGVFQEYYETHQLASFSPSTVSWIPAVSMCTIFLAVC